MNYLGVTFLYIIPHFQKLAVIGQANLCFFLSLDKILCMNVCLKPRTLGHDQMQFPPVRCFARLFLQLASPAACLWVSLHSGLSSVTEKHAQ